VACFGRACQPLPGRSTRWWARMGASPTPIALRLTARTGRQIFWRCGQQPRTALCPAQCGHTLPVTLYTSANCPACDGGRTLLQGRGIPFTEKTVNTTEDARVLQSREGTNSVPVIRIGSKQVTGFEQGEWTSYLDAAGYPQQSALPNGYRQPAATPLAPTANPPQLAPEADPAPKTSPEPTPAPPAGKAPPGFRF
jgi:glutaredoxin